MAAPKFELLNVTFFANEASFLIFPKFPAELRIMIWNSALQEPRLIGIELGNGLKRTEYNLNVWEGGGLCTLMLVNREARHAALKHYRVRIRLNRYHPDRPESLFYNPEYDILSIRCYGPLWEQTIAGFVQRMRELDPQGVGIRRVTFVHLSLRQDPRRQTPAESQAALATFVAGLWEVMWTVEHLMADWGGRDANFMSRQRNYGSLLPILPRSFAFSTISRDPREIEPTLRGILFPELLGGRLQEYIGRGQSILENWKGYRPEDIAVEKPAGPAYGQRIMFGCNTITYQPEECVIRLADVPAYLNSRAYENRMLPIDPPECVNVLPQVPAAGFWVFPMELLDVRADGEGFDRRVHWPVMALARMEAQRHE